MQGVAAEVQGSAAAPLGELMQGLGRRLVGKKVLRFWHENVVQSYQATTGQHRSALCTSLQILLHP